MSFYLPTDFHYRYFNFFKFETDFLSIELSLMIVPTWGQTPQDPYEHCSLISERYFFRSLERVFL